MAFSLFGLLLCIFLLIYSGIPHSSDEFTYLGMSQSLARGQPPIPHQVLWMADLNQFAGRYVFIALMLVPFNWLSSLFPQAGVYQSDVLLMPFAMALTGALMFSAVQELGYSRRVSFLTALALVIGTPLLVYSKYLFREPLAALGLAWLALSIVRLRNRMSPANLLSMSAALIFSVAAKNTTISAVPGLLLCLWLIVQRNRQPARMQPTSGKWARWILPIVVAVVIIISVWLVSQTKLIASAISFFGGDEGWGESLDKGLAGLLISPGRGLFWFAPILFIAFAALPRFFKKYPIEAVLVVTVSLASLLFHAGYAIWWGGRGWGPRYLLPIIPLWCFPLAEAFDWAATLIRNGRFPSLRGSVSRFALLGGIVLVVGLSTGIQLMGAGIAFDQYEDYLGTTRDGSAALRAGGDYNFALKLSPFVIDPMLLKLANLDFVWIRARQGAENVGVHAPLVASLILSAGWFAASIWLLPRLNRRRDMVLAGVASLIAVSWTITNLLSTAYADERYQGGNYQAALQLLSQKALPGDGLLIELQLRNWFQTESYFLNYLRDPNLSLYSLFTMGYPTGDINSRLAYQLLQPIVSRYHNFWLHDESTQMGDPANQFEHWLNEHEFLVSCDRFNPHSQLCLYSVARQTGTKQIELNVIAGDQIRLAGGAINTDANSAPSLITHPGADVQLALNWTALGPVQRTYKVFIQLIDASGTLRQQIDREPVNSFRPTNHWAAGEVIEDRYAMRLGGLEPGQYRMIAGLYDSETIARLPLRDAQGKSVGDFVELAVLDVR